MNSLLSLLCLFCFCSIAFCTNRGSNRFCLIAFCTNQNLIKEWRCKARYAVFYILDVGAAPVLARLYACITSSCAYTHELLSTGLAFCRCFEDEAGLSFLPNIDKHIMHDTCVQHERQRTCVYSAHRHQPERLQHWHHPRAHAGRSQASRGWPVVLLFVTSVVISNALGFIIGSNCWRVWIRDLNAEGVEPHPGPGQDNLFRVTSANISSLPPRWTKVARWDTEVLALQETRLGVLEQIHARDNFGEHGWDLSFGMPMKHQPRSGQKVSSRVVCNGGVLIGAKSPHTTNVTWANDLFNKLHRTSRWTESAVALGRGNDTIVVSSLWGYTESSKGGELAHANNALIKDAIERGSSFGACPYVLCMDVNQDPSAQEAIRDAIRSQWWADAVVVQMGVEPPPTFRKCGVCKSMKGPGVTRIDTILVNRPALAALRSCSYKYKQVGPDHVAIVLGFELDKFDTSYPMWIAPPAIPMDKLPEYPEAIANQIAANVVHKHIDTFNHALGEDDIDGADRCWHAMAYAYLEAAIQERIPPAAASTGQKRGDPPQFEVRASACMPVRKGWGASTAILADAVKLESRMSELYWTYSGIIRRRYACIQTSQVLIRQTCQLWTKIYRTYRYTFSHKDLDGTLPHVLPPFSLVLRLHFKIRDYVIRQNERSFDLRRTAWRQHMSDDIKSNHARRAYAYVRGTYNVPVHAIEVEGTPAQAGNAICADPISIHQAFARDWEGVFHKHGNSSRQEQEAQADLFLEKFGRYIPRAEFQVRTPNSRELWAKAQRNVGTAGGLDGWRDREIAALPQVLWALRVPIIELSLAIARLPQSQIYAFQVHPAKTLGVVAPLDTRPIRIYSYVTRVEEGCFFDQLQTWSESWVDPWIFSKRGADTHQAFMDLSLHRDEMAIQGLSICGGLVDTSKYFDLFRHKVLMALFARMGLDHRYMSRQWYLWKNQRVTYKIAGAFSEFFTPDNGLGQGHVFALIATAATSTVWARYIRATCIDIGGSIFIDDRALRHTCYESLVDALEKTVAFDDLTGHTTNVGKSSTFSSSAKVRSKLRKTKVGGASLQVSRIAKYLGFKHQAGPGGSRMMANEIYKGAIERIIRVKRVTTVRRHRKRLIRTSAVAKTKYSSLGGKPSRRVALAWRASAAKALGGDRARARAVEVRTAILNEACQIDAQYSMALATVHDTLRVIKNSDDMFTRFSHVLSNTPFNKWEGQPGAVQSMLDACTTFDWSLGTDLTVERGNGKIIDLRKISKTGLNKIANADAADQLMAHLGQRCRGQNGDRKDFKGLDYPTDVYATRALIEARGRDEKDELDRALTAQERGRVESILEGALPWPCRVRRNDKSNKTPAKCDLCFKTCRADAAHYNWDCRRPEITAIRTRYINAIEKCANDGDVCYTCTWQSYAPYRHNAVIPEDRRLAGVVLKEDAVPDRGWVQTLELQQRTGEKWINGKKRVVTDGSCLWPDDIRRATASSAVCYGHELHAAQRGYTLPHEQTSYNAEAYAVFIVVRSDVDPLWISLDNLSVVEHANQILEALYAGRNPPKSDTAQWIWDLIIEEIRSRHHKVSITWLPGHLDDLKEDNTLRLCYDEADVKMQITADVIAGAAALFRIERGKRPLLAKADARVRFARLTQLMYLDIWCERLNLLGIEEHERDIAAMLEDPVQAIDQIPEDPNEEDPNLFRVHDCPTIHRLKEVAPNFWWNYRERAFVTHQEDFINIRVGDVDLQHRGKVLDRTFSFDPYLWKPFLWYVRNLMWPQADINDDNGVPITISFAELAIDFEITTGRRIREPAVSSQISWAKKGRIFATLFRTLKRHSKTFKKEFFPRLIRTNSMHAFGVPKQPGLSRRPNLLQHSHTERIIAANALEYSFLNDDRKHITDGFLNQRVYYGNMVPGPLIRYSRV